MVRLPSALRLLAFGAVPLLAVSAALVVGTAPRTGHAGADVEAGPTDRFDLTLDGATHRVEADKPFELQLGGRAVQGRLAILPTRRFDYSGISFDYPRHYAFEVDRSEEPGSTMWTLDGNDVVLMVHRHRTNDTPAAMVEAMAAGIELQLGGDRRPRAATSLQLGDIDAQGARLKLKVASQTLEQVIVAFKRDQDVWVITLQDGLDDNGELSAECRELKVLLEKTFKSN